MIDEIEMVELDHAPADEQLPSTSSAVPSEPVPSTSDALTAEPVPSTSSAIHVLEFNNKEGNVDVNAQSAPLDSEILEILGDDPSVIKEYSKDIQADLAVRLQHVAIQGLTNEIKKQLQEKYLPPANCPLIDAPMLNPEIKAALTEPVIKRDKSIELKQKQLSSAISSIGEALTLLMTSENKDTQLIKLLIDASRILCNCQNTDSLTRRNFILFNLKKDMKDQLLKTKIDKYLFGADLSESIKMAKTISKSGAELKAPAPSTSRALAAKAQQLPGPASQVKPQRSNLNWRGPPPNRRLKGIPRTKDPAPRTQPGSSSRPSYRPPPSNNRSRR